ncbi:MAG: hypothetical protein QNK37_08415 [Acidobacteriota bacterium]|nr:hypothetical protein [Acidobacteriota bacterium]
MDVSKWNWLADTFWYVPEPFLPALQLDPGSGQHQWMVDQTVWHISAYELGYFWGTIGVLTYPESSGSSHQTPVGMYLQGSVLPDGRAQITFVPKQDRGASAAVTATGVLTENQVGWGFNMQMSTGSQEILSHWARMLRCYPGDDAWKQLPGTDDSLPEFMKKAGQS